MLGRVTRALSRSRVEEAATCARALTVLAGRQPRLELLPGAHLARAALTARILVVREPAPWPCAVSRQIDPDDPAFLPPLGLHPVLAARDRSWLSLPGRDTRAWVDPHGWMGTRDGPAVCVWFGEGRAAHAVLPGGGTTQGRGPEGLGICTRSSPGDLRIELLHWPVVLSGRLGFAIWVKVALDAPAPRPIRVGFAIRPMGFEGTAPIFHLTRSAEGLWVADGQPILALAQVADELLSGTFSDPDPWLAFSGRVRTAPQPVGVVDLRCGVGQASACEVFRRTLLPEEPQHFLGVFGPAPDARSTLARTSGRTLWAGAVADRKGLLASGCMLDLDAHTELLGACRMRLLARGVAGGPLADSLGAVALARLGFSRRACERLSRWLTRVRRTGAHLGDPHTAPTLAWALAETCTWTGDSAWAREQLPSWRWLLGQLKTGDDIAPGALPLFPPDGSRRWTTMWTAAALLSSATALRGLGIEAGSWALAGGRLRERLVSVLGDSPWRATRERAPDGSAAAMLLAVLLGLVAPEHPGVRATCDHLVERFSYGGGVLLHGGAHVLATTVLTAARARRGEPVDLLGTLAALSSSTGVLPTVRHPTRGALGEGDDALSAALFVLSALEQVRAWRGTLLIGPRITRARDLPTPFGRIDIERQQDGGRRVLGRWRGQAPDVQLLD